MDLRIMVTGATGTLGSELVRILLEKERDVVAVTRDLERLPQGVKGIQMAFENRSLLEQAFRDIDVLVFIQPLCENMIEQAQNVISAAQASGVQFVLKLSGYGASRGSRYLFQRVQGEADALLTDSRLHYCIVQPNIYMQCFLKEHLDALMQGVLYLPEGEGRTSFVDARDVAEATAQILEDPWRYHRKILEFTGGRAISNAEAVSIISYNARRRISYVPITEDAAKKLLFKSEGSSWMRDVRMTQFRAAREGSISEVTGSLRKILGREPRSFEVYCEDVRSAWQITTPPEEQV